MVEIKGGRGGQRGEVRGRREHPVPRASEDMLSEEPASRGSRWLSPGKKHGINEQTSQQNKFNCDD